MTSLEQIAGLNPQGLCCMYVCVHLFIYVEIQIYIIYLYTHAHTHNYAYLHIYIYVVYMYVSLHTYQMNTLRFGRGSANMWRAESLGSF